MQPHAENTATADVTRGARVAVPDLFPPTTGTPMTNQQDVRDGARAQTLSFREAKARLEAIIAEAKEDADKRKIHFGHIETSEGNI
ncbi:hypothetical protein [Bradyrhizobium sp. LeoA1S1]